MQIEITDIISIRFNGQTLFKEYAVLFVMWVYVQ